MDRGLNVGVEPSCVPWEGGLGGSSRLAGAANGATACAVAYTVVLAVECAVKEVVKAVLHEAMDLTLEAVILRCIRLVVGVASDWLLARLLLAYSTSLRDSGSSSRMRHTVGGSRQ
jgi:hypothetical protein